MMHFHSGSGCSWLPFLQTVSLSQCTTTTCDLWPPVWPLSIGIRVWDAMTPLNSVCVLLVCSSSAWTCTVVVCVCVCMPTVHCVHVHVCVCVCEGYGSSIKLWWSASPSQTPIQQAVCSLILPNSTCYMHAQEIMRLGKQGTAAIHHCTPADTGTHRYGSARTHTQACIYSMKHCTYTHTQW